MEASFQEYVELSVSFFTLASSIYFHLENKQLDCELSRKELSFQEDLTQEEESMEKITNLFETLNEFERHFNQLNADMISSIKEAERDMFDQRMQQYQTITIASSIMLTALISVLIQGVLPVNCSSILFILYALSNSLSLGLLTFSIILSTEIISKCSLFMSTRLQEYKNELRNGIKFTNTSFFDGNMSKMNYSNHRETIQRIMETQHAVNTNIMDILRKNDFNHFWTDNMLLKSSLTVISFYFGSILMISANVIFMWAVYLINFNSFSSSIISVACLGISCLVCTVLIVFLRHKNNDLVTSQQIDRRNSYLSAAAAVNAAAAVDFQAIAMGDSDSSLENAKGEGVQANDDKDAGESRASNSDAV